MAPNGASDKFLLPLKRLQLQLGTPTNLVMSSHTLSILLLRSDCALGRLCGGSEVFDLCKESVFSEHLLRVYCGPKWRRIKSDPSNFSVKLGKTNKRSRIG